MWFKNVKLYRIDKNTKIISDTLKNDLLNAKFTPCNSQEPESSGFASLELANDQLVYDFNWQMLIKLRTEKKLLPSSVINQATKERASIIEEQQGYKPGRKQTREIKEQITMELLPKAFSVQSDTYVWIDPVNHWLAIDAVSQTKCDQVMGALAKCLKPFPVLPLHVEIAPSAAMTRWLIDDEPPAGFTIDQDVELKAYSSSLATVRYIRQSMSTEEAQKHAKDGKQCTRLALTWNDKISFVLTENLELKKITPLDVIKESAQGDNEKELFAADFALMTGELNKLFQDLTAALGGIKE